MKDLADALAWAQIAFAFATTVGTIAIYTRLYRMTARPLYWHIVGMAASHLLLLFLLCSAIPFGIAATWPNWRWHLLVVACALTDVNLMLILLIQLRRMREVNGGETANEHSR